MRGRFGFTRGSGGGALVEGGCYTVSVARWFLGGPVGVDASARLADGPNGVDMTVSALLRFAGGATASVWASFEGPEEQELTVVTKHGRERLERPFNGMEPNPYQLMVESFAQSALGGYPVVLYNPMSALVGGLRPRPGHRHARAASNWKSPRR